MDRKDVEQALVQGKFDLLNAETGEFMWLLNTDGEVGSCYIPKGDPAINEQARFCDDVYEDIVGGLNITTTYVYRTEEIEGAVERAVSQSGWEKATPGALQRFLDI